MAIVHQIEFLDFFLLTNVQVWIIQVIVTSRLNTENDFKLDIGSRFLQICLFLVLNLFFSQDYKNKFTNMLMEHYNKIMI